MFDNSNPYTIRTEKQDGIIHYIVSFYDGQGSLRETEVTEEIAEELNTFIRRERNLRRWDERHLEQFFLSDEMLHNRIYDSSEGLEHIILKKELATYLHKVINDLPQIQRRRFLFYFQEGLRIYCQEQNKRKNNKFFNLRLRFLMICVEIGERTNSLACFRIYHGAERGVKACFGCPCAEGSNTVVFLPGNYCCADDGDTQEV